MLRRTPCALIAILLLAGLSTPILAGDDEAKVLYDKKCAMCHGKDGVAKKMAAGAANLNDPEWQQSNTVESIVKVTVEGKGKMPKYEGKLTHEQIEAVAKYVLTLK